MKKSLKTNLKKDKSKSGDMGDFNEGRESM